MTTRSQTKIAASASVPQAVLKRDKWTREYVLEKVSKAGDLAWGFIEQFYDWTPEQRKTASELVHNSLIKHGVAFDTRIPTAPVGPYMKTKVTDNKRYKVESALCNEHQDLFEPVYLRSDPKPDWYIEGLLLRDQLAKREKRWDLQSLGQRLIGRVVTDSKRENTATVKTIEEEFALKASKVRTAATQGSGRPLKRLDTRSRTQSVSDVDMQTGPHSSATSDGHESSDGTKSMRKRMKGTRLQMPAPDPDMNDTRSTLPRPQYAQTPISQALPGQFAVHDLDPVIIRDGRGVSRPFTRPDPGVIVNKRSIHLFEATPLMITRVTASAEAGFVDMRTRTILIGSILTSDTHTLATTNPDGQPLDWDSLLAEYGFPIPSQTAPVKYSPVYFFDHWRNIVYEAQNAFELMFAVYNIFTMMQADAYGIDIFMSPQRDLVERVPYDFRRRFRHNVPWNHMLTDCTGPSVYGIQEIQCQLLPAVSATRHIPRFTLADMTDKQRGKVAVPSPVISGPDQVLIGVNAPVSRSAIASSRPKPKKPSDQCEVDEGEHIDDGEEEEFVYDEEPDDLADEEEVDLAGDREGHRDVLDEHTTSEWIAAPQAQRATTEELENLYAVSPKGDDRSNQAGHQAAVRTIVVTAEVREQQRRDLEFGELSVSEDDGDFEEDLEKLPVESSKPLDPLDPRHPDFNKHLDQVQPFEHSNDIPEPVMMSGAIPTGDAVLQCPSPDTVRFEDVDVFGLMGLTAVQHHESALPAEALAVASSAPTDTLAVPAEEVVVANLTRVASPGQEPLESRAADSDTVGIYDKFDPSKHNFFKPCDSSAAPYALPHRTPKLKLSTLIPNDSDVEFNEWLSSHSMRVDEDFQPRGITEEEEYSDDSDEEVQATSQRTSTRTRTGIAPPDLFPQSDPLWMRYCMFFKVPMLDTDPNSGALIPGWNDTVPLRATQAYIVAMALMRIGCGVPLVILNLAMGSGKTPVGLAIAATHIICQGRYTSNQPFEGMKLGPMPIPDVHPYPEMQLDMRMLCAEPRPFIRHGPKLWMTKSTLFVQLLSEINKFFKKCPFKIVIAWGQGFTKTQRRGDYAGVYHFSDKLKPKDRPSRETLEKYLGDEAKADDYYDNLTVKQLLTWSDEQDPPPPYQDRWLVITTPESYKTFFRYYDHATRKPATSRTLAKSADPIWVEFGLKIWDEGPDGPIHTDPYRQMFFGAGDAPTICLNATPYHSAHAMAAPIMASLAEHIEVHTGKRDEQGQPIPRSIFDMKPSEFGESRRLAIIKPIDPTKEAGIRRLLWSSEIQAKAKKLQSAIRRDSVASADRKEGTRARRDVSAELAQCVEDFHAYLQPVLIRMEENTRWKPPPRPAPCFALRLPANSAFDLCMDMGLAHPKEIHFIRQTWIQHAAAKKFLGAVERMRVFLFVPCLIRVYLRPPPNFKGKMWVDEDAAIMAKEPRNHYTWPFMERISKTLTIRVLCEMIGQIRQDQLNGVKDKVIILFHKPYNGSILFAVS